MKTVNIRSQIYLKKLQLTERKLLLKVLKESLRLRWIFFYSHGNCPKHKTGSIIILIEGSKRGVYRFGLVWFLVFNAIFNNISVMLYTHINILNLI